MDESGQGIEMAVSKPSLSEVGVCSLHRVSRGGFGSGLAALRQAPDDTHYNIKIITIALRRLRSKEEPFDSGRCFGSAARRL